MLLFPLEQARKLAEAVIAYSHREKTGALTVAVLDSGGHPRVVLRDDDSEFLRVQIAIGKAWGALGMGVPSRLLGEKHPQFLGSLAAMSVGKVVPVPGGVLVRQEGAVIGAVGVSGDTSEADERAAVSGIEAAGLQPDYGQVEEWRRP